MRKPIAKRYLMGYTLAMKALVVGNWKMNPPTFREAKLLFEATKKAADGAKGVSVVVAPPSIYIRELSKGYRGKIAFAVQNANAGMEGAHTGEISFAMAKDAHVEYGIVGHAERRAMGETNEDTKLKVKTALAVGITPILCVGETSRTQSGAHFQFVREQLRLGLSEVTAPSLKRVVIAYEPVWAIGASTAMSPRDMHEMSIFIRKSVVESHGEAAHALKILYGGSIDSTNAPTMLKEGDVHGLLVGRASADASHVRALLQAIGEA